MARPECFEFAMEFLGGKEEKAVREYVDQLEQALQNILDCTEIGVVPISYLIGIAYWYNVTLCSIFLLRSGKRAQQVRKQVTYESGRKDIQRTRTGNV